MKRLAVAFGLLAILVLAYALGSTSAAGLAYSEGRAA